MVAVDTNVLLRIILRDDEQQAAVADSFVSHGAWVSVLALAETVWVLASIYGRSPSNLVGIIEVLLNHENLTLQDADAVTEALDLFRLRPALGFSDCLTVSLARKAGHLPLGTFDRVLGRIDGAQKL